MQAETMMEGFSESAPRKTLHNLRQFANGFFDRKSRW